MKRTDRNLRQANYPKGSSPRRTSERQFAHAQMLAGIAAQVAATYRDGNQVPETSSPTMPMASTTSHDPSWDFRIPEEYRG